MDIDHPTPEAPAVVHRDDQYHPRGFARLLAMQRDHFWYRGRHRFLMESFRRHIARHPYRLVDIGGGCGGWAAYVWDHAPWGLEELALADSSPEALESAADVLPDCATRHQVDVMDLPWEDRWDAAFLLDVIEHLPDDTGALRQVYKALAPGGLLFITVPALMAFWTWNDDHAHHLRRYSTRDLRRLAASAGFEVVDARYFMFFLSPLLVGSRLFTRPADVEAMNEVSDRLHAVPRPIVNRTLAAIFGAETPLGHRVRFPWGTSALAVFRKPGGGS